MIFKKSDKKLVRPPMVYIVKVWRDWFNKNETPAIAGIAIAGLCKAGKETV